MSKKKRHNSFPYGWFPSANTSNHYVYLASLENDNPILASATKELLKVNRETDEFNEFFKLTEAISFLRICANNERKKEQEFIKTKISPEYATDSIEGIITAINEKIVGIEEFKRRVETEKERHGKKGRGAWSATQGYANYIKGALQQVYGLTEDEETANPKDIAKVTRTVILNEVFKILGPYGLSANECATIAGLLQSQITPFLLEQLKNGSALLTDKTKKISSEKLRKVIKGTNEYQTMLGNLRKNTQNSIDRVSALQREASKILQGFLSEKSLLPQTKQIERLAKVQETKYLNMLTDSAKTRIDSSVLKYNITGNRGHGGEFRVWQDLSNQFSAILGSKGGKTDVRNISVGSINIKTQLNKILSHQKKMDKITDARTQELFTERGQQFEEIYTQMGKDLEAAQENLENKEKLFIEHYSVKDYATTNESSGSFSGFEGAKDMKMTDFINAISGLSSAGFNMIDINWLITCLMNTAEAALGANNKPALERNLSIFVTMLLFDDGLTIAKEAAANPYPAINVLHIFPLNGIYVPSSVVMEEIANQLEQKATEMRKAGSITINTGNINFPEELQKLTDEKVFNYHRWESIRETQKSAMTLRIKFLANFFDIISRL